MCFSSNAASNAADSQAKAEAARQKAITQGMGAIDSSFAGFNDDFYNKQAQAYSDYYTPQVNKQYQTAGQNTLFGLTRSGLNDSSAGAKAYGDLDSTYGTALQNIASGAQDAVNQEKQTVQTDKNALYAQLNATGNPQEAASAAQAQASLAANTQTFSPLVNLFQQAGTAYGNYQNGQYYNPQTAAYQNNPNVASLANPNGIGASTMNNNNWMGSAAGASKLTY